MDITKYPHIEISIRQEINLKKIPLVRLQPTMEGVDEFNRIYKWFLDNKTDEWHEITFTRSGGVSVKKGTLRLPAYFVGERGTAFEMIFIIAEGQYRFLFGRSDLKKEDGTKELSGRQSYLLFRNICNKYGVDLDKYGITNGEEVKKTIPEPMISIKSKSFLNLTFENVHHIDLNSSFMSGIALNNPELYPPINDIYSHRKDVDENGERTKYAKDCKDILTHTYGFFQSKFCYINHSNYALAHLSKQALEFNNHYIEDLTDRLLDHGYTVIAYNTDGLFYTGGEPFHDFDEGTELGQWKTDHVNCKIRFKSSGAYEYIEDGKYHPVVRGLTRYEKIKPRTEWEWGDIYKATEITLHFEKGEGIVYDG